jgi:C-terminal peptidase prc
VSASAPQPPAVPVPLPVAVQAVASANGRRCAESEFVAGPRLTLAGSGIAAGEDQVVPESAAEEETDYWKDVRFGRKHFEEVLEYVRDFYIDDSFDEGRAYAEAANFALMEAVPERPMELLPEAFFQKRKSNPAEEGALEGKTLKLATTDRFLIHEVPSGKNKAAKPKKRLDDEALREHKKKESARARQLEKAWAKVGFNRKDFDRVMGYVREQEKKDARVKLNKVWVAAAQGYLFALDPHSALVNKQAWDESVKETEDGSFDGIGAVLEKRGDDILIESPIEGQPAHKVGLRAGDVVLRVDDVDVTGLELMKVVKMIRGPRGTKVKLTIRRLSEPEDMELVVTRAHIEVPNVQGKLLPHHKDVGYVKVTGFVDSTATRLEEEINHLARATTTGTLRGLVIDLRNNPGGLLDAAISVADLFMKKGKIVIVKNSMKNSLFSLRRDELHEATGEAQFDMPAVVLVNEGSASASEIVASALQENRRALVVGRRTFGKATVQTLLTPRKGAGYYIKLTVSRYYGPSGRTLQAVGVFPDFEVPPEPGQPIPVAFREEDLSHHLKPLEYADGRKANVDTDAQVGKCLQRRGIAEKLSRKSPNPAIRFDFELFSAADVLECAADQGTFRAAPAQAEPPPAPAQAQ